MRHGTYAVGGNQNGGLKDPEAQIHDVLLSANFPQFFYLRSMMPLRTVPLPACRLNHFMLALFALGKMIAPSFGERELVKHCATRRLVKTSASPSAGLGTRHYQSRIANTNDCHRGVEPDDGDWATRCGPRAAGD